MSSRSTDERRGKTKLECFVEKKQSKTNNYCFFSLSHENHRANHFKEDIRVFVFTAEVHGRVVDAIKNFTATRKTAGWTEEEEGRCSWSDSKLYITV